MENVPEIAEITSRAELAGVSVDDVLRKAGIASTTWWRWSEGRCLPRLSTLRKVRAALEQVIAEQAA